MKFYSYTNNNKNYTKAISLENIRSVERLTGSGKSAIRFSIRINYFNSTIECFDWLEEEESKKVFNELTKLLNKIEEQGLTFNLLSVIIKP